MINIENDGIGKFRIKGENYLLRAVRLVTVTDNNDTLVEESFIKAENGEISETEGHIFILTDELKDDSRVFIVAAPDCVMPSFKLQGSTVEIKAFGYPISVGTCASCDAERLCRYWYSLQYIPEKLHAMSNTWGDRNGRTRVNEEFIRREIDSASELGLDVVQIDDGWQKGVPDTYAEDGLRVFEGDFWQYKEELFPNGMQALSSYAAEKEVHLGLWFAPHSREVFKYFSRDVEVLKNAYESWGVRYFKLDMLQLITEAHCNKMLDFLDTVSDFGEGVTVELDVTADKRLGYLMSAPYGTIFVENRYTAWSNYYPHRTLRNLWMLSKFIPTSKFQFELLNTDLNKDKYDPDDELRPELYDVDYLFASVMLSNPLFWMETQFLSLEKRDKLKKIISLWKKHREKLTFADVYPIGEEPSGKSITGFVANCGEEKHIILFRELTERNEYVLSGKYANLEPVASNSDFEASISENGLSVKFAKPRSYVWLIVK